MSDPAGNLQDAEPKSADNTRAPEALTFGGKRQQCKLPGKRKEVDRDSLGERSTATQKKLSGDAISQELEG